MNMFWNKNDIQQSFKKLFFIFFLSGLLFLNRCGSLTDISGKMKQWHPVTITFTGPSLNENSNPNPFLDYKMEVKFIHQESGQEYEVPGYYAADGNAANTGASTGN